MAFHPLYGRARELAELEAALDRAMAGRGSALLISGEPGVGKTRLVEELQTVAERRGAQVVWGRAWEVDGAPALWPWTQAMRGLDPGAADTLAAPLSPAEDPDAALVRRSASILAGLRAATGEGPLVV